VRASLVSYANYEKSHWPEDNPTREFCSSPNPTTQHSLIQGFFMVNKSQMSISF
jgi:hypothetical protein